MYHNIQTQLDPNDCADVAGEYAAAEGANTIVIGH